MSRRKIIWQLYPSFFVITIVALFVVTWFASKSLKEFYLTQASSDLESRTILVAGNFPQPLLTGDHKTVDSLCKSLGENSSTRITVILPNGKVIGDTDEDPSAMDNHGQRPEIEAAFAGTKGESIRFSQTLNQNLMYVALPLYDDREIIAVVRTAFPLTSIERPLSSVYNKLILGGLLAALLSGIVIFFLSRRISRPLEILRKGARKFAAGELDYKLPVPDSHEIGSLAESMNQMAHQLHERINIIINQRNEQDAVLTSMVEGVIAVDTEEKILTINQAAGLLLGIESQAVENRGLQEVIRNTDLRETIREIIQTRQPIEKEIILHAEGERCLQVNGTLLHDNQSRSLGAMIVLNDVTKLRRLETVRREFVANVSHELRTPITSIKGFVETLLDGALNDHENATHFLGIVGRQADRLNAIITDLLALSRIELESETAEIILNEEKLIPVIESAVEICEIKAREKNITISIRGDSELTANLNAPLIEQAIINLVDNAIKHSESSSSIEIKATQQNEKIDIAVIDHGAGIKQVHIPRLFERFYRVDKARSRDSGGTGLGLAIVKHIARAHGGSVGVESSYGEGSTFTLTL